MKSRGKVNMILALAVLVIAACPVWCASVDSQLGQKEVEMGKEAAAQVAKEQKLSDNAADLKRVRDMGQKIAAIANVKEVPASYGSPKVTPFEYEFNIIEEEDINAFSVPGGHIYVYRGLLNFVQSDDELAGVLAHEIVHASHHHMVFLLKKQAGLQNQLAIALLAMIISGAKSSDLGNIVLGVQLYQIAKLNGYGMEAERDSDRGAVYYAHTAGYNPVGLLTFLERLAQRPEVVDWGIYRSHPLDADRVRAAMNLIAQMGLKINRRATTRAIVAEVKTETVDGVDTTEVVIQKKVIYRPAPLADKTPEARARETAEKINNALDAGIKMHELSVDPSGAGVVARGNPILVVSDADAKLMGKTPAQVAQDAAAAIREILLRQMVDTIH